VKLLLKKFVINNYFKNDNEKKNLDDVAITRFAMLQKKQQLRISKMSN